MNFEKNIYTFVEELKTFHYRIQSIDHIWNVIFSDAKQKWHHIQMTQYKDTFYIALIDNDICGLEVKLNKSVAAMETFSFSHCYDGRDDLPAAWDHLITAALRWLKFTKKDWVKANKQVQLHYPLNRRKGIVPNAIIRESLSDIYRIDKALGKRKTQQFIKIVESDYFHKKENTERSSITVNDFFDYCKIAYIAASEKNDSIDTSLSGKEMYERFADGRDEGLLSIRPNSKKEFAQWIDGEHPKKNVGGHPWEIKRGGNTTHIDLIVMRPSYYLKENFQVMIRAPAITRLKEAICMFLAIHESGLPITIDNFEGIRNRLLAQDNIGIVPTYDSLHRANQSFYNEQEVYDVCYFDDFGRYKQRIKPFITWEPLPILKPL